MRINIPAVIVAALAQWLLGFLWYAVIFSKKWLELMGWDEKKVAEMQQQGSLKQLVIMVISALIITFILAVIFARANVRTWVDGVKMSAYIWLAFVALIGMDAVLFEQRNYGLYQIGSSYRLVGLVIAGAIIGGWKGKP